MVNPLLRNINIQTFKPAVFAHNPCAVPREHATICGIGDAEGVASQARSANVTIISSVLSDSMSGEKYKKIPGGEASRDV